ncbi:MAG: transcriptional repressor [Bacteroidales bacterium]|jgi:Fur family peroxide stress response transcriptional regulator|nr:transcriptional repressor [Bacteroidota bacterium]NMD15183.1 transcriptional repressor [Bacteroidales bacterium]HOU64249.1 transcriptional repressor [Tenuifilaceae bacterium]HQM43766.1 transcriptional repressor [Smithellaceae bacterium]HPC70088.1 transcriptional repressor [Tenuifilaceae bacterium]
MKNDLQQISEKFRQNKLKITPQRIAIYNALLERTDHPTAEVIYQEIQPQFPGISLSTVYNTLEMLCEKGLIQKVKTGRDNMRYDAIEQPHHHLYSAQTDRMEDYFDEELDQWLKEYFSRKHIKGFKIQDIKLQITGIFEENNVKL